MKSITVKCLVSSRTYKGLIYEAEKKISNFYEIEAEDVKDKVSYEITVFESSNDGVSLPIFSGEITARLRSTND
jgi:hypothetical protein